MRHPPESTELRPERVSHKTVSISIEADGFSSCPALGLVGGALEHLKPSLLNLGSILEHSMSYALVTETVNLISFL